MSVKLSWPGVMQVPFPSNISVVMVMVNVILYSAIVTKSLMR